MRRSGADSELWEIYVSVRNYGVRPHTVNLSLDFGPPGTPAALPPVRGP